MKKILLFALLTFAATVTAQAQATFANGNLETWTTAGTRQRPTGWVTTDDLLANFGSPFLLNNVTRTTASRSGMYAARLATASFLTATAPGILSLGSLSAGGDFQGVRYTARPARFEFYYTLTGANAATDSATAAVVLTRRMGGTTVTVADTSIVFLAAAPAYTRVSLPLQYRSALMPDTLRIFFISGGENATVGTVLTVDDVALTGTAAVARDARAEAALEVYPSRSADGRFTLSAPTQPALLAGALSVTDAAGRVVLRQAAGAAAGTTRTVQLAPGTPAGLYLLRLETATGAVGRKLVIE